MKKMLFIVFSILLFVGCGKDMNYVDVDMKEAKEMIAENEIVLLDVRSSLEYSHGHIENAVNLDVEQIDTIETVIPNKNAAILVYCQSGNRSKIASTKLIEMGYTKVYNMVGGVAAYEGDA